MLESAVETKFRKTVKALGGRALKFVSPGNRGVPDRIVLFPIPEEHREIVAKCIRFVELKAPKKKPRPDQVREHQRLRDFGFFVQVIDK